MNNPPLPRVARSKLTAALRVMPAVIVSGARQAGKTTLARMLDAAPGELPRRYHTLDDQEVRDVALNTPDTLVGSPDPLTLDEVQRAPTLLSAVKRQIDRDRRPGRFLLTGSANLLLMQRVSESLAGRAAYITLWPMAPGEQDGGGRCGTWELFVGTPDRWWADRLRETDGGNRKDWRFYAKRGGFPVSVTQRDESQGRLFGQSEVEYDRAIWFGGYVQTYLERDLQALSSIAALGDYRRLMQAAALRLGTIVNQSEIARDIGLPQPTVHRYLNLLETSYLLLRVPAYSVNRTKRLIKSPKLYWGDTGLAMHLSQEREPRGAHFENLVLQDLLVWRDSRLAPATILHWRTTAGHEVDFVIECGGRLIPIEIKATSRPRLRHAHHLLRFRAEYGDASRAGLLLHDGDALEWLGEGVLAVPWWRIM